MSKKWLLLTFKTILVHPIIFFQLTCLQGWPQSSEKRSPKYLCILSWFVPYVLLPGLMYHCMRQIGHFTLPILNWAWFLNIESRELDDFCFTCVKIRIFCDPSHIDIYGQRSLAGYSPQGHKDLGTVEMTWHIYAQRDYPTKLQKHRSKPSYPLLFSSSIILDPLKRDYCHVLVDLLGRSQMSVSCGIQPTSYCLPAAGVSRLVAGGHLLPSHLSLQLTSSPFT